MFPWKAYFKQLIHIFCKRLFQSYLWFIWGWVSQKCLRLPLSANDFVLFALIFPFQTSNKSKPGIMCPKDSFYEVFSFLSQISENAWIRTKSSLKRTDKSWQTIVCSFYCRRASRMKDAEENSANITRSRDMVSPIDSRDYEPVEGSCRQPGITCILHR